MIRMKMLFTFLLLAFSKCTLCQEPGFKIQNIANQYKHEFYAGYGIFSMREVTDASLYSRVTSSGVLLAGYNFKFNDTYSVGFAVGSEKIQPFIKGRPDIDSFYVKTNLVMVKVQRIIATRNKVQLYMAGSVGIMQVKKLLINGYATETKYGYEFVLAGLKYQLFPWSKLFVEAAYGDFCLLKGGLSILL